MLSYHNDPEVKAKYVARFVEHRRLDQVIQRYGFENGRGCFVGCTLNDYDHDKFPAELGWPVWLAHLSDTIFEGLHKSEAPQFGTDLLQAVPVGVDLEPVKNKFLIGLQKRNLKRLEAFTGPTENRAKDAIKSVIDWLESGAPAKGMDSARAAAQTAASAAWAAADPAWAAAWAAAGAAARSKEFETQRDDLISIIRSL